MTVWKVAAGTDAAYQVTIRDDQGAAITSYAGTETLSGKVWTGGDMAAAFSLTVAWDDHAAGTISVAIDAASTEALGPGAYRAQVELVDSGGKTRDVFEGALEVFLSPLAAASTKSGTITLNQYAVTGIGSTAGLEVGWTVAGTGIPTGTTIRQVTSSTSLNLSLPATRTGTASLTFTPAQLPVYCQYADMLHLAPWIGDLQSMFQDETGFARQRAAARTKLDKVILASYRGHTVGQFDTHSDLAFAWAYGGGNRRSVLPSPILRDWLNSGGLMLDDDIVRMNAHWAVADVCMAQMGRGRYASYGAWHRREGDKLCACTTAQLDINGDGLAEIGVPLSSTNTLFT